MTNYDRPTERPAGGRFDGFDHIHFWVSNAKQVATFYIARFGFIPQAYRGLETKSRQTATHVVKQNDIVLAFSSPLLPEATDIGRRLMITGDAVKDVAFRVEDCRAIYRKAIERGAKSIQEPVEDKDEHGSVVRATVQTYGDTVHSFIERKNYSGPFLPGFIAVKTVDPLVALMPSPNLRLVDHVVGNQPDNAMQSSADWYQRCLDFHRFWSVDDKQIHTEFSSLRSVVVTDFDRTIKMPLNEPAEGKRKSQIQEYVDYHGGPGVQHIALKTDNILHSVANLRARGLDFLSVPSTYYENVRKRLARSPLKVKENLDDLQKLNLLIDFDDRGYLMQIFTKPVEDRPTLFFEVIQRQGHDGFGAGNFKALFEAIERDQEQRGNLSKTANLKQGDHGEAVTSTAPYQAMSLPTVNDLAPKAKDDSQASCASHKRRDDTNATSHAAAHSEDAPTKRARHDAGVANGTQAKH